MSDPRWTPEEILAVALRGCEANELTAAINIVRSLTAGIDPSDPNTYSGLVNLWRSVAAAARAEIESRDVRGLVTADDLDQLDRGVPDWFGTNEG